MAFDIADGAVCRVVRIHIGKRHELAGSRIRNVPGECSCGLGKYAGFPASYQGTNQANQNEQTGPTSRTLLLQQKRR